MLFNSYGFIFAFLPVLFIVNFYLAEKNYHLAAKVWLVLGSLFFYGYWNPMYLPLILGSILGNFVCGLALSVPRKAATAKLILFAGIAFNLGLLGYYKYVDFFIETINQTFASSYALPNIILPLGISFFTFTQIAFLVDAYRKEASEYSLVNYALFVTYFPHLLAGPILHHKEMMPQFDDANNYRKNYRNIAVGLFVFALGLFKKVVIADTFAQWANLGFASTDSLNMLDAWLTSLSYTFQLYFDFSGYTDMAIGVSLLFNIRLPANFNSPYKALNIQDFWRRWHITLSRFLRNYVYIPLGGNRKGSIFTYTNLMLTFLIGGFWHGAGWTFIIWGGLHGVALVIHRLWQQTSIRLPVVVAWLITFNFVNLAWVFFRADSWTQAVSLIRTMFDPSKLVLFSGLQPWLGFLHGYGVSFSGAMQTLEKGSSPLMLIAIVLAFTLVLAARNSMERMLAFRAARLEMLMFLCCITTALLFMSKVSEFIYFNF